jgi:hypothetical protein
LLWASSKQATREILHFELSDYLIASSSPLGAGEKTPVYFLARAIFIRAAERAHSSEKTRLPAQKIKKIFITT